MTEVGDRKQTMAVPALAQGFAILDALSDAPAGMRLSQLARETGLPKTTTHRLLKTLVALDIVSKRGDVFVFGARMARYGSASLPTHTGLISLFYSLVGPVNRTLDETVQLGVLFEREVTFIAYMDTSRPVRLMARVGRTLPAHASATGKAILAFSPAAVLERVVGKHTITFPALTNRTITSPDLFLKQLEQVRELGWAEESEESAMNLSCVSAPILNGNGHAEAAVTACVARSYLEPARKLEIAASLMEVVKTISRQIG